MFTYETNGCSQYSGSLCTSVHINTETEYEGTFQLRIHIDDGSYIDLPNTGTGYVKIIVSATTLPPEIIVKYKSQFSDHQLANGE